MGFLQLKSAGLLVIVVHRLLVMAASLAVEPRLQKRGLSNCG